MSGCAYIGEPLPPALKIPVAASDLTALQRGDKIYVNFTIPTTSTEGLTLKPAAIPVVHIGETEPPQTAVEKTSSAIPWVGKTVIVGVQFRGPSGRMSAWSNFVHLKVVAPVVQPAEVAVNATATGVEIQWQGTAKQYRVFRDGAELVTVDQSPYNDKTAQYGQKYDYTIQGIDGASESEISKTATITPEDTFPPEVPAGVVALSGVSTIEVSWERSIASDLAFYRVYRDGKLVADKQTATTFSDSAAKSGQKYVYTVSSVDAKMNESAQSTPVEITFP